MKKFVLFGSAIVLSPFIIMGGALGLVLAATNYGERGFTITVLSAVMVLALSFFAYRNRHQDLINRKLRIFLAALFIVGFFLYIMTGNMFWFLAGVAAIPLIILWFNYLRFPPYFWRAVWLYRKKRFSEAFQIFNQRISTHPEDWKAFSIRSDIHLSRMQFVEAERDSRCVIRLQPDFHFAHNQLGRSLVSQGRYAEARESFRTALGLRKDVSYQFNMGATSYRLGDFTAAVYMLTKACRREQDFMIYNLLCHYFLGRSLEGLGQPEKAKPVFKRMARFAHTLKMNLQSATDLAEYPEIVAVRADLEDIQQRLTA